MDNHLSKAEKTRAFIIERSAPVFNKKGYGNTSLNDIMEATGLSKGAIYGNFADRNEVAIAVFNYNVALLEERLRDAMAGKSTAYEKLLSFFGYYRNNWRKMSDHGGCPVQNASIEADDHVDYMKIHVQQTVRKWVNGISKLIAEGQAMGEFRTEADPVKYAYIILTSLEGAIMLFKIMNNQTILKDALDRIIHTIDTELKI